MPARSEVEAVRKWLHLAPGVLAFGLAYIGFGGALVVCAALLGFNLWILPRFGGARLWRASELAEGEAWGIVFYPLALLVLAVASGSRLEVLAGGWGMLAFGDAAATLVGQRWGRRALPWNAAKTWIGSLAFVAAAWGSVVILVPWTAAGRYGLVAVMLAAALAALAGALVESLPWTMDDNLSVTLFGGATLFAGLEVASYAHFAPAAGVGWGVSAIAVLALGAHLAGALDRAGTAAGAFLALAMLVGGGWRAVALLAFFVFAATIAGHLRQRGGQKVQPAVDEPPRGAKNALANGVVAASCGFLIACQVGDWALLALGGALATATADTVGGELGQAFGGRTRRLSDGREVPPGTDGGVSWAGSLATVAGAALLAGLGLSIGFFDVWSAVVIAAAGTCGALMDSLLGATLESRGLLDNEAVNCLSTLTGAWLAVQAWIFWG